MRGVGMHGPPGCGWRNDARSAMTNQTDLHPGTAIRPEGDAWNPSTRQPRAQPGRCPAQPRPVPGSRPRDAAEAGLTALPGSGRAPGRGEHRHPPSALPHPRRPHPGRPSPGDGVLADEAGELAATLPAGVWETHSAPPLSPARNCWNRPAKPPSTPWTGSSPWWRPPDMPVPATTAGMYCWRCAGFGTCPIPPSPDRVVRLLLNGLASQPAGRTCGGPTDSRHLVTVRGRPSSGLGRTPPCVRCGRVAAERSAMGARA